MPIKFPKIPPYILLAIGFVLVIAGMGDIIIRAILVIFGLILMNQALVALRQPNLFEWARMIYYQIFTWFY